MLRLCLRRAARAGGETAAAAAAADLNRSNKLVSATTAPISRLYSSSFPSDAQSPPPQKHQVSAQMIQYALRLARSQKSEYSYSQALLVLEQGISNLRAGDEGDGEKNDAAGMLLLAMSSLLHERGEVSEAIDKLQMVRECGQSSLGIRVAAFEGLVGLNLEAGQDATSSLIANECLQMLISREDDDIDALRLRGKAVRGLVDLVLGDLKSAESTFAGTEDSELDEGNVLLSYGEFHHASGNFTVAKDFYERAVQISEEKISSGSSSLSSVNMVPEEVRLGATCALGQLLAHSGKFLDAEKVLTKALTSAEEYFGLNHPKVGTVLTCMAVMFGHKAKLERSSSLIIQEGLYRRAIDLLKAPSLNIEGGELQVDKRDVVALARGGYAETLCVQQNRKGEGEQLRKWAKTAWRNRRLSLAEALEMSEPSKASVVDTRISRVL